MSKTPRTDPSAGDGHYDNFAAAILKMTEAEMVMLLVGNGEEGSGFSLVATDRDLILKIPRILREVAAEVEQGEAYKAAEERAV